MSEKKALQKQEFSAKMSKILIADDEEDILYLMENFLSISLKKAQIITAKNGIEAYEMCQKNSFDIICTDQKMPYLSGSEFVNLIRNEEESPNYLTPILFITSYIDDAKKSIKFQENIFYLTKPFDSSKLWIYIDSVMLKFTLDLVTEKRELIQKNDQVIQEQEKLVQSARIASYSEFSSNITHELNNPLAIIEGLTYLLKDKSHKHEQTIRYAEKILSNIERIKKVVNNLRNYALANETENKLEPIDINQVIDESFIIFLQRLENSDISYEKNITKDLPIIRGNQKQLERVFQILILNSIEAFDRHPSISKKKILITTLLQGHKIITNFSDNAGGVHPSIKAKIFDPFTSTKDEVAGVGFGLSFAYGVIKNIGGKITVDNDAGQGCIFTLEFPIPAQKIKLNLEKKQAKAAGSAKNKESYKGQPKKAQKKKRILIIDDELGICEIMESILEDDYEVTTSTEPEKAINIAKKETFDLVITDFKMPKMNGMELIKRLQKINKNYKFIIISGHLVDLEQLKFQGNISDLGFIPKPFGSPVNILKKIEQFITQTKVKSSALSNEAG